MSLTPEDLNELFRSDVDDEDTDDPLWSDTEIYSYMDQAQKQFARDTDYFSDASTTEIVDVAITAADPFVTLDPRIIKIRGGKLASSSRRVTPKKYADMEKTAMQRDAYDNYAYSSSVNWESATGIPLYIITDLERNKGRLAPIPTSNDTLNLHVFRLPLEEITAEAQPEFEIDEIEYIRGLMYYMKYLAYQKNDADIYNDALSQEALGLWGDFTGRVRRDLQRLRFGSTVGTVAYGGL